MSISTEQQKAKWHEFLAESESTRSTVFRPETVYEPYRLVFITFNYANGEEYMGIFKFPSHSRYTGPFKFNESNMRTMCEAPEYHPRRRARISSFEWLAGHLLKKLEVENLFVLVQDIEVQCEGFITSRL